MYRQFFLNHSDALLIFNILVRSESSLWVGLNVNGGIAQRVRCIAPPKPLAMGTHQQFDT